MLSPKLLPHQYTTPLHNNLNSKDLESDKLNENTPQQYSTPIYKNNNKKFIYSHLKNQKLKIMN